MADKLKICISRYLGGLGRGLLVVLFLVELVCVTVM
jgi:hypothetical protein